MKKKCLSLFLVWCLLLTSVSVQGHPSIDLVQDVSDFKFEGVDRHPKSDKSLDGEWVKILKFTSFGIIFFTPIGLLNFGSAENLAVTNQLLGIEGLNKAVLECNEKKLTPLSSILGKDDQELFISYLRAKQAFTTPTGKKISLQVLNKKDRMQTSMQETREVVRNFILHLKERKQLQESVPLLEEKINSFLRQFGYVVFSENTLKTLSTRREISSLQMESLLLKNLAKVHILTKKGQIYQEPKKDLRERVKKVFTPNKYAQSEARAKLMEMGFYDKEEQLLLHDLGYLGLEDLQLLKEERWSQIILEKHTKGLDILKMNPNFYQDWGKKLDTLLTHHLTYEYHLQEALDRLILESLVGQKDIKQYAKDHLLPTSPKSEHGRLHLLRLAAMHEWRLQQSSATFLDLETLLVNIKGEMIKHFSARNVQSKNFTILRVKGENIAEASLSYVVGTGFMTAGAASTLTTYYPIFTSYLSVILQQNIAMAMAYVHYITPWGLIVGGGVAGVLTLSKLITHSLQYHQLSQDKGLLAQEIDAIDQQLEQSSLNKHEKNKLKAMKLFDLMDKYLLLKKQKLLFGNLEMDSLWLAISIVAASLGVVAFLSVIGVVASIVMPYVGLGVHLFFLLCFLIYVVLYMNEKRLTDDLLLSSKAFAVYKQIYQMAAEEEKDFSPAQKEFLELCFNHVHRSLSMAKYAQGITSTRLEFLQGTNYERMEEQFTQL